jgi:hypothetical protein
MDPAGYQECSDLLVVGVRGTLAPHSAGPMLGAWERLAGDELSPFAEELLVHWLKRASRELNTLRMLATNTIAGEPVPLNGVLLALKLRLLDLISPALGELSSKADVAAFWQAFLRITLPG